MARCSTQSYVLGGNVGIAFCCTIQDDNPRFYHSLPDTDAVIDHLVATAVCPFLLYYADTLRLRWLEHKRMIA